jgi:hypothetical protein
MTNADTLAKPQNAVLKETQDELHNQELNLI